MYIFVLFVTRVFNEIRGNCYKTSVTKKSKTTFLTSVIKFFITVQCNSFLEPSSKYNWCSAHLKPTEENNRLIFCMIFENKLPKNVSLFHWIEHRKNRKYLNLINIL